MLIITHPTQRQVAEATFGYQTELGFGQRLERHYTSEDGPWYELKGDVPQLYDDMGGTGRPHPCYLRWVFLNEFDFHDEPEPGPLNECQPEY